MAGAATGQVIGITDLVQFFELESDLVLVAGGRGPEHVGDLVVWAEEVFGVSVAVEAPGHGEGLGLADDVHLVNAAMAGDAGDPFVDVCAVVEIGVIRKIVYFNPGDGGSIGPGLSDVQQGWGVGADGGVAIHADLGGGNGSEGGGFDGVVAVAAVDAEPSDVDGVGIGEGLFGLIAYGGGFWGSSEGDEDGQVNAPPYRYENEDGQQVVGRSGEDESGVAAVWYHNPNSPTQLKAC